MANTTSVKCWPVSPCLEHCDIVLVKRNSRGELGRNFVSSIMYGLIRVLFRFDVRVLRNLRHQQLALNQLTLSS